MPAGPRAREYGLDYSQWKDSTTKKSQKAAACGGVFLNDRIASTPEIEAGIFSTRTHLLQARISDGQAQGVFTSSV
jgi:hypothetical protein